MQIRLALALAALVALAACSKDDQSAPAAQQSAAPAAVAIPAPVRPPSVYENAAAAPQVKALEKAVLNLSKLAEPNADPRAMRGKPVTEAARQAYEAHENALDELAKVIGPSARGWARHEVSKKVLQREEMHAYRMQLNNLRRAIRQGQNHGGPRAPQK